MYIVRWLMGHPMIAIWVLAALAILFSFSLSDKNELVEESTHVNDNSNNLKQTINPIEENTIVDKSGNLSSSAERKKPIEAQKQDLVYPDNAKLSKDLTENKEAESLEATAGDREKNTELSLSDLGGLSTDDMLLMAREAYWNNGLDEATKIYKYLIETEPNVVEHKGELGNVYWKQGYPKKAAELYSEISLPMIEQGKSDRVSNMIGFIGLFYPDRAAEIHQKIQQNDTGEK